MSDVVRTSQKLARGFETGFCSYHILTPSIVCYKKSLRNMLCIICLVNVKEKSENMNIVLSETVHHSNISTLCVRWRVSGMYLQFNASNYIKINEPLICFSNRT